MRGLVALVCVLLASAPLAAAQTADPVAALVGRPVVAIHVDIDQRPDDSPDLQSLLTVAVGQPLRLDAVRESLARLASGGRYDDVEVLGTDTAAGVEVRFHLTAHHPIDRLEFRDDTGLQPGDLDKQVRLQIGGLTPNLRPRAVTQAAIGVLQDEGYLSATIVSTESQLWENPDRATLVVHVKAGPRTTVGHVEVTGTSSLSAGEVISRTATATGSPYRPRVLAADLAKIRDALRANRYYEAQAYDTPHVSADRTSVDLDLVVDAGPQVTLAFDGDPAPAGDLDDLVPIARENSADDDLLDDSDHRLAAALQADGYREAAVTHSKARTADTLAITFHITRGPRYVLDAVTVDGNQAIDADAAARLLGVRVGDVYSAARINAGMAALQAEYLARGYYKVVVTPHEEEPLEVNAGPRRIALTVEITEGPRAEIADVVLEPATLKIPATVVRGVMVSRPGAPFVARNLIVDQARIESLYADRGFPSAAVAVDPRASADGRAMTLDVSITEGPQIVVGSIRVIGNERVSTGEILDEMTLKPGDPYGAAARLDSQQRILATGGFRNVTITTEPMAPTETRARVVVIVEEAPATTLGYGAGVAVGEQALPSLTGVARQRLFVAPRGFFEIGRENVGGRNRSLDFFSRVSLEPKKPTTFDPASDETGFGFNEYTVSLTYRERRAFHSDTDIQFGAVSEQVVQTDFNYLRQGVNADVSRRVTPRLTLSGRYALSFTRLFDVQVPSQELLTIDRILPDNLRLSSLSAGVAWDRRNDPIAPWHGTFTTADVQVASDRLGSQVGFVKTFLSGSAFHALTGSRRYVLAARAEVGLAHGFLSEPLVDPTTGQPVFDPNTGQAEIVASLPASERFFAGGSTTVRGFDQDLLGVPILIDSSGLSLGGNGVVILNAEIRTRVAKLLHHDLGVVGFVDSGNVFLRAVDIDLSQLRTTSGFGLRYDSPLGPVRLDYGFKLDRQIINGALEPRWTWYLSLGEAF